MYKWNCALAWLLWKVEQNRDNTMVLRDILIDILLSEHIDSDMVQDILIDILLSGHIDSDMVQDIFQADMCHDGYFDEVE